MSCSRGNSDYSLKVKGGLRTIYTQVSQTIFDHHHYFELSSVLFRIFAPCQDLNDRLAHIEKLTGPVCG